jgi:hypothetical protein
VTAREETAKGKSYLLILAEHNLADFTHSAFDTGFDAFFKGYNIRGTGSCH